MEQSIWSRFRKFIQESVKAKFTAFFSGSCMGLYVSMHFLFAGLPSELVTVGAYILKYIGTCILSFSSGLLTAYGAYLIEKIKNKQNVNTTQKKRKKGDRAA